MLPNDLKAIKVAAFTNHQKLILASNSDGKQQLFLNKGQDLKLFSNNSHVLDFAVAPTYNNTYEVYLITDIKEAIDEVKSGALKGLLASKASGKTASLVDDKKGENNGGFVGEIE